MPVVSSVRRRHTRFICLIPTHTRHHHQSLDPPRPLIPGEPESMSAKNEAVCDSRKEIEWHGGYKVVHDIMELVAGWVRVVWAIVSVGEFFSHRRSLGLRCGIE